MLKVKICGITNLKDALLAEQVGADLLGFVFYAKSSRYVSPSVAGKIISQLSPLTRKVGVFVNEPASKVLQIARNLKLDFVQLAGEEDLAYVRKVQLNVPVIKAFRVGPDFRSAVLKNSSARLCLLDAKVDGFYGGSGRSFDWKKIYNLRGDVRLMLAGGISSENVEKACQTLQPAAVDLTSSVEAHPGKKDPAKLKKFFEVVNAIRQGR